MGGWQEENGCIDPGRVGPGGNLVNDTDGFQMSNHSAHSGDWETAKSTTDCRKMDATGIVAFRQADVGEYLRDEDTLC